jgi:thiol-disulfide isomerase/thioredoxin
MFWWLVACIPDLTSPKVGACAEGQPDNAWFHGDPPSSLQGEGFEPGEVVTDQCVPDQNGEQVSLWQFYGNVWVLDVSTMWCQPCQDLARGLQDIADSYEPEGFTYLTVLAQDLGSDVPDQAELQQWADTFDIASPIVADDVGFTSSVVRNGSYPAVLIIGRDATVVERLDLPSDEAIAEAVEAAL